MDRHAADARTTTTANRGLTGIEDLGQKNARRELRAQRRAEEDRNEYEFIVGREYAQV
jgi:hypothetical protein